LSINSKINNILSKYAYFGKYEELHKPILVPARHFKTLLDNFDENQLVDVFKTVILELMPADLFEKKLALSLDNWLKFIFGGVYLHTGIFQHFTHYTDDQDYLCLVFRHTYGIKWSKVIDNVFGELIKNRFKCDTSSTMLPSSVMLKILERRVYDKELI
jgi:hypothetical protein